MPKRKAASCEKQGSAEGAKKPHTEGAAAAAADAADGNGSFDAAVARANLAPRIATHTLKLMHAFKTTDGSFTLRMQAVVDLLKQDADRPESLLNLSLVAEGEKVSRSICRGGAAS
jgi:hypothetical protein